VRLEGRSSTRPSHLRRDVKSEPLLGHYRAVIHGLSKVSETGQSRYILKNTVQDGVRSTSKNSVLAHKTAPDGRDRFLLIGQHLLDHKTHLTGVVADGLAALTGYSRSRTVFLILDSVMPW
jgi:hypothetical protein